MEMKYHLFDIGQEEGIPIWDMIRVPLAYKYLYHFSGNTTNEKKGWMSIGLIVYWVKSLFLLLHRNKFVFVSDPIGTNTKGYKVDNLLYDMIEICPKQERLLLQHSDIKGKCVHQYYSVNLVRYLLRLLKRNDNKIDIDVNIIVNAYRDYFGVEVSRQEVWDVVDYSCRERMIWISLLKWLKPKKLFVVGNHYPIYAAARFLHIESYEFQHAGISYDYLSYSYPEEITSHDNLCWANYYVMFGSGWGNNNNIPAKRICLGNNIMRPSEFTRRFDNKYYLIISESVHYELLRQYAKDLAQRSCNMLIIYKLHPNEFRNKEQYKDFFREVKNVVVLSNEYPLYDLIFYMQLMVLVYSSSFFEAMSLNKKVAVIKEDNYYVLNSFIENNPNAAIVESIEEIIKFAEVPEGKCNYTFYDAFNKELAKKIYLTNSQTGNP